MIGEEDYILRPVLEKMCSYESLRNGTLKLYDLMLMNEALDVQAENAYRLRKAQDGK